MLNVLEVNVDDRGYGGVFAFVKNMLHGFLKYKNIHLDICTFEEFENIENIKKLKDVYNCNVIDCSIKASNFITKQIRASYEFYKEIKRNNYNVIHIHSDVAYKLLLYGLVAHVAGAKKIIVHSHSSGVEGRYRKLKLVIQRFARKILSVTTWTKLACSVEAGKWMYCQNTSFRIVRNGIIVDRFKYDVNVREKVRSELGITEDEYLVGTVARFSYPKNPEFVLEIMKAISKCDNHVKFLWIGDGDLKKEIMRQAKSNGLKNIIFYGNTDKPEEMYNAMDCFVLPSKFEGLCLVGVEAQVSGLKALFSDKISKEILLTESASLLDIDNGVGLWVKHILDYKCNRINNTDIVKTKGYDISETVRELYKLYI